MVLSIKTIKIEHMTGSTDTGVPVPVSEDGMVMDRWRTSVMGHSDPVPRGRVGGHGRARAAVQLVLLVREQPQLEQPQQGLVSGYGHFNV